MKCDLGFRNLRPEGITQLFCTDTLCKQCSCALSETSNWNKISARELIQTYGLLQTPCGDKALSTAHNLRLEYFQEGAVGTYGNTKSG